MTTYKLVARGSDTNTSLQLGRLFASNDDQAKAQAREALKALKDVLHYEAFIEIKREDGAIISDLGTVAQAIGKPR